MELRIYNAQMDFQGLLENQTSVLWNRKYYESGDFEIYAPVTANNMNLLKRGNLVWIKGNVEAGVIESIQMEQSDFKNQVTAKGRFLESYMARRLIRPTYYFDNRKVEEVMQELISNAVAIPLVQLGTLQGYDERVSFQATYKNLLDYETKLAKYGDIGFRFKPDFTNKTITFETYRGKNHTWQQNERTRVLFSETYNNITEAQYTESEQLLKTVCYVGGEGEGSSRIYAIAGDDTLTGLERREVYINASSIRKENLTTAQYQEVLKQQGNNELQHDSLVQSFECETDSNRNFIYKKDYDLGDIVTVQKLNWGVSANLRMAGITEIYEYGAMKVSPILGNPLPETIDWSDNDG